MSKTLVKNIQNNENKLTQLNQLDSTIIDFLEESEEKSVPTLVIAKAILGKNAKTSQINPFLYDMQKRGLLEKSSDGLNGAKPKWNLK
jgi:DNA-binding PadR family transcriptional regulator